MQTNSSILPPAVWLILEILSGALVVWVCWRWLQRSESPRLLLFKWFVTAGLISIMVFVAAPLVGRANYQAYDGVVITFFCGLALAATWRHNIASLVAAPLGSLYDGGSREIDPEPAYSVAISRRKQGKFNEAIAHIRGQLEQFPKDFQGQMMIAEIQAENLNDLLGAQVTIHRLCQQPGHAPRHLAMALNTLADWHLKYALDRDAACGELELLQSLMPDSEFASLAASRIVHMASSEQLLYPHQRRTYQVKEGPKNLGLMGSIQHLRPKESDPEAEVAACLKQLETHPQDTQAREQLAVLYADYHHRLDLAEEQLNQLIEAPHQPMHSVVRWLNLLADLQVRHEGGFDAAWQSLARIIEKYPKHPAAELARHRMELLKLELKAKEKNQAVKLGSYEQNIGLKRRLPG